MKLFYTHRLTKASESHHFLELAIAEYLGDKAKAHELAERIEVPETSIGSGKPFLRDFGRFSISHSEGTWAVLIGDTEEYECGLDIQYRVKCSEASIARRFYASEDAQEVISAVNALETSDKFFRIWARREALIKAAGSSVAESDVPAVSESSEVLYKGRSWNIYDIQIPDADDLFAAICVEQGQGSFNDADSDCSCNLEIIELKI